MYKKVVMLSLMVLTMVAITSCKSGKEPTNYNRVMLYDVHDYVLKKELLVEYLAGYEDDEEDICLNVVPDLVIFEMDITDELNDESVVLTPEQVDTLRDVLFTTRALKSFFQCIARCEDYPTLSNKELKLATTILGFSQRDIGKKHYCAKIYEVYKEKFLFYFIVNDNMRSAMVNYTYRNISGRTVMGKIKLNANHGGMVFGLFDSYAFERADFLSISCRF